MTKLVVAVALAVSAFPLGDIDSQPACRERCEQAYREESAACEQAPTRRQADACQEAAQDRHQECIDRCND